LRKKLNFIKKYLLATIIIIIFCFLIWSIGHYFLWSWGNFSSDIISNAVASAIIGYILYWVITRPDEKKANSKRRDQALAILRVELTINFERAELYKKELRNEKLDISSLSPFRFTRGAWNALRESGFLPQLDDISFVYQLLRVNEILVIANSSLSTIRRLKTDGKESNLISYIDKAVEECSQIENQLSTILDKLNKMNLPEAIIDNLNNNDIESKTEIVISEENEAGG